MSLGLWGIPLFFFTIFLILYRINRTGLAPSFMLSLSLFSAASSFALYLYHNDSAIAKWCLIILLFTVVFVAAFGIYALIAFLFLNERAILKRERKAAAHFLPLLLASALILYMLALRILDQIKLPFILTVAVFWIETLVWCYAFHVTQFILASVLCNLSRPRKNQDYIIVLGAGLAKGSVTPLLAARINRAITFYKKQQPSGKPPKFIMSGGQGADEPRPEAEAMAEYAHEHGIPTGHILKEPQSTTTFENMRFSKLIMDSDSNGRPYHAIYATNNYHVLRAGIYARKAGLKINGIGAKTASYYLPSALLREYIAYVSLYRKRNVIFAILCLLFSCGVIVLLVWFS